MIRPRLVIGFAEAVRRSGDSWRLSLQTKQFMASSEETHDGLDAAIMKLCLPKNPFHKCRDHLFVGTK